MEISEIRRKGKSELYYVYVNGELFGLIQAEMIYKNKLKTGTNIDVSDLERIKQESDQLTCFSMALNYVAKMLKTEQQVRDYLKKHLFCQEAINGAIEKLKSYGYINDLQVASFMLSSLQKRKGKNAIKQDLLQKGINKEQVESLLCTLSGQAETCEMQAKKWLKSKSLPLDKNDKAKLYRFLIGKGFEFDIIKKVLNKIEIGGEDDWYWFGRKRKN